MISKKDIVAAIGKILLEHGPAKSPAALASLIVDDVFAGMASALVEGEEVVLPGLGKLKAVMREARTGRNLHTGEPIQIAATRVAKLKVGKDLKALLATGAV